MGRESAPLSPTLEKDPAHPNGRGVPDSACRGEPGKESFELGLESELYDLRTLLL